MGKKKVIDITPTWAGIMPVMISILESGTPKGKQEVKEELMRLAREVDEINKKKLKKVM